MGTLAFLLVVLAVAWILFGHKPSMVHVWSSDGAKQFYVKNVPGSQEVADYLQKLEQMMASFLDSATRLVGPNEPRLNRIKERWNGELAEVDDPSENVAYSMGKSTIHICVREEDRSLASLNVCFFVLAHELAHVATTEWGHTDAFWRNMRFLLELGERTGHYTYVDHDELPQMLCGRVLGTSPQTCVKEKRCASELLHD